MCKWKLTAERRLLPAAAWPAPTTKCCLCCLSLDVGDGLACSGAGVAPFWNRTTATCLLILPGRQRSHVTRVMCMNAFTVCDVGVIQYMCLCFLHNN